MYLIYQLFMCWRFFFPFWIFFFNFITHFTRKLLLMLFLYRLYLLLGSVQLKIKLEFLRIVQIPELLVLRWLKNLIILVTFLHFPLLNFSLDWITLFSFLPFLKFHIYMPFLLYLLKYLEFGNSERNRRTSCSS